ncbi:transcription antitermination factor NusB [Ligilactobacillus apodemi]|uniref:Transcription antitermination protein NusB n=1 Tax=Ligilactobacillus apodemi DSM 16634 = JCM 16172 TaxID=1423724 RepID=A0A0R1TQP3_9LACO|nr:transcription antitermination factor NusB [Ligilactobacillus apodemi]KRL83766.1 transcription antitermination protein NusB [Ligilactobacillus apodemi DSM 16634 = JCM 16172]MCR1900624.1 transcription antitermination factor NusB [Ligilactobacillus apodemi]
MSINRHDTRKLAFQALFALNSNPDALPEDVYEALLEDNDDLSAVPAYLPELVEGVRSHQTQIDEKIAEHLSANWSLARLNKTDLLILRLAIFEMLYVDEDEVPAKVALDEALQLAKEFSDDKSRRFVNGVLSNLI